MALVIAAREVDGRRSQVGFVSIPLVGSISRRIEWECNEDTSFLFSRFSQSFLLPPSTVLLLERP